MIGRSRCSDGPEPHLLAGFELKSILSCTCGSCLLSLCFQSLLSDAFFITSRNDYYEPMEYVSPLARILRIYLGDNILGVKRCDRHRQVDTPPGKGVMAGDSGQCSWAHLLLGIISARIKGFSVPAFSRVLPSKIGNIEGRFIWSKVAGGGISVANKTFRGKPMNHQYW